MLRSSKLKIIMIVAVIFILIMPNVINANTVEYRGEAEGLIATPEDFFLDFGELMPGDKKEGKALIKNNTKEKIEVFFKTEELAKSEEYDEIDDSLLQKISLKIKLKTSNEEKDIYEGNLGAEAISKDYISLGTYEKDFDGEFIFEIEVPKELKNIYALSSTEVKWVFYVVKESDENDLDITDTNTTKPDDTEKDNVIENIINNVKTGDYIYFIIGIMAILVIINIIIIGVRRGKKDEK